MTGDGGSVLPLIEAAQREGGTFSAYCVIGNCAYLLLGRTTMQRPDTVSREFLVFGL